MTRLRRNWGNDYQLRDLLDAQPGSLEFATRDFALLTMAANLVERYPAELVFKGGFVLRHVHGVLRFSKDLDATRDKPPRARMEASDVARVIDGSSIGDQVQFRTGQPATDSPRSLDFDRIEVKGALLPRSHVQLEVS